MRSSSESIRKKSLYIRKQETGGKPVFRPKDIRRIPVFSPTSFVIMQCASRWAWLHYIVHLNPSYRTFSLEFFWAITDYSVRQFDRPSVITVARWKLSFIVKAYFCYCYYQLVVLQESRLDNDNRLAQHPRRWRLLYSLEINSWGISSRSEVFD